MTVFNGPAVTDTVGSTPSTEITQALLNSFLLVQTSYLITGGIPVSASATSPPLVNQPALQAVINSGTGIAYIQPTPTTVMLGAGSTAQDNYVDVDNSGAYHVSTGAVGFTPGPPAANTLRLYKATTNSANNGVTGFLDIANRNPLVSSNAMLSDGSNAASLVTFLGNLTVAGTTTLNNDVLVNSIMRFTGTSPSISVVLGAAAGSGPSGLTINGDANAGNITFTTGSAPPTGTLLTISCTPGGSRRLQGILFTGSFNSGSTSRYLSQSVVSVVSGTYSVSITVSATGLAAATLHTISYMLLWA